MHDYEIRILNSNRGSLAYIEIMEPSDAYAIRSAERIAGGRPVEVWHDIECIYRSDAQTTALQSAA
jgi:hypothetical protein